MTIKIQNFLVQKDHPNSEGSVFFSFGTNPYIPTSSSSTYEVILYWKEELSTRSGTLKVTRYSSYCPAGYFTTDGSSYSFSVSKYTLGSGPLSVYISVSLGCITTHSHCHTYCIGNNWRYRGISDSIRVDPLRGKNITFLQVQVGLRSAPIY